MASSKTKEACVDANEDTIATMAPTATDALTTIVTIATINALLKPNPQRNANKPVTKCGWCGRGPHPDTLHHTRLRTCNAIRRKGHHESVCQSRNKNRLAKHFEADRPAEPSITPYAGTVSARTPGCHVPANQPFLANPQPTGTNRECPGRRPDQKLYEGPALPHGIPQHEEWRAVGRG